MMEKYSRGRRGAPAKGVGRVTGARVQIPLSPLASTGARKELLFFSQFVTIEGTKANIPHKSKKVIALKPSKIKGFEKKFKFF